MTPMQRVNITLDAETLNTLDQIRHQTGAARSEILRRAVIAYARELANPKPLQVKVRATKNRK